MKEKKWAFCRWCGQPFYPRSYQAKTCSKECSRQTDILNQKRYYEERREIISEQNRRRREEKPELYRERGRAQYKKHRESRLKEAAIYNKKNPGNSVEAGLRFREREGRARQASEAAQLALKLKEKLSDE